MKTYCWGFNHVCMRVYLSELIAGLAVCNGRLLVQKSSTVNFPSCVSAPYIAITLPRNRERKAYNDIRHQCFPLIIQTMADSFILLDYDRCFHFKTHTVQLFTCQEANSDGYIKKTFLNCLTT